MKSFGTFFNTYRSFLYPFWEMGTARAADPVQAERELWCPFPSGYQILLDFDHCQAQTTEISWSMCCYSKVSHMKSNHLFRAFSSA